MTAHLQVADAPSVSSFEEVLRELVRQVVREELVAVTGGTVATVAGASVVRSAPRLDQAVYSAEEVATLLGCSRKAVYARASRLQIPGGFKVGRRLQFRGSELIHWLTKGRAPLAGGRR